MLRAHIRWSLRPHRWNGPPRTALQAEAGRNTRGNSEVGLAPRAEPSNWPVMQALGFSAFAPPPPRFTRWQSAASAPVTYSRTSMAKSSSGASRILESSFRYTRRDDPDATGTRGQIRHFWRVSSFITGPAGSDGGTWQPQNRSNETKPAGSRTICPRPEEPHASGSDGRAAGPGGKQVLSIPSQRMFGKVAIRCRRAAE